MSEAAITPEILELILRTSRVKGCRNVYSLTPRGHRVGVYFQQRRAALLAAALRSRLGRGFLENCSVGIVGGGAAGLTFRYSIENEGATDISLYERSDRLVHRGRNAAHRLLHPNYNRWPLLGSMDVFTNLPMLNWYAASADRVAAQLKEDVTAREEPSGIFFGHAVTTVVQRPADRAKPVEVLVRSSEGEHRREHSVVVIASGFGDEKAASWDLDDYWNEPRDYFDEVSHKRPCTVYGTGDGALIDVIRACAVTADNAWQLPLALIGHLRPAETHAIPADTPAGVKVRPPVFSGMEKSIQAHEESVRCVAWPIRRGDDTDASRYVSEERDFYVGCIREMRLSRSSALPVLDGLLKPMAADPALRPTLAGVWEQPFEPTSAPINKLLLAYLLETGRVRYDRRTAAQCEKELEAWQREPAARRGRKIVVCRFGAALNFSSGPTATGHAGRVEVEVEGSGPVHETPTEAHLLDALSSITGGEHVYFDTMPSPLIRARFGMEDEMVTNAMRRASERVIKGFVHEHLDGGSADLDTPVEGCAKWVVTTTLDDTNISRRLKMLGGLDGSFLGAPIVRANVRKPVRKVNF